MADTPQSDSDSQNIVFDGRYKLVSKIGAGGMGAVWLGYDMVLDKSCAIKVLLPNSAAEAFIRFHQEAKMAAKLSHPNIISVFDFGQSDRGDLYLIMDFLDGESLTDWTKKQRKLNLADAMSIFLQICSGLEHAHSQGVLHRDIKPSNIMLVKDDRGLLQVKIVDFGLAKFEGVEQSLTTTGVHVGSPLYMSPEQAVSQTVDHRADIYSFGCLMFKTLTKRTPFQGETLLDILNKHANDVPSSINDVDPNVQFPHDLAYIVEKTLRKEPDDRFQSVSDLREALLSINASFMSLPSMAVSDTQVESEGVSGTARTKDKHLLLKILVGIGSLFICATFIIYAFSAFQNEESAAKKKPNRHFLKKPVLMDGIVGDIFDDKLIGPMHGRLSAHNDFGDDDMKSILRFKDQNQLSLENSQVTGKTFSILRKLPLIELNLRNVKIDDNDLVEIARNEDLEILRLGNNKIGDQAIKNITPLSKLKDLEMENTLVTDAGLQELSKFPSLFVLNVNECKNITGAGLQALSQSRSLRSLSVVNCKKITRQDENKFRSSKPTCILKTTETEKLAKQKEKKKNIFDHENPDFQKFLKYKKDMYSAEFRNFFRDPKNWKLNDSQIAKLKNKRIVACLKDRDYIGDPKVHDFWLSDTTWLVLTERQKETESSFDILSAPMEF